MPEEANYLNWECSDLGGPVCRLLCLYWPHPQRKGQKTTLTFIQRWKKVRTSSGVFFNHPQTRAWSSSFHRTRRNPWSRSHPTKRQWCLAKYIFKHGAVLLHSNIITSSNSSMIPSSSSSVRGASSSPVRNEKMKTASKECFSHQSGPSGSRLWWSPGPPCRRPWRRPSTPSSSSPCQGPRPGRWRTAGRTHLVNGHDLFNWMSWL